MKPAVAITVGDYNGIGPEIVLKSLRSPAVRRMCRPVLIGPEEAFAFYARKLRLPLPRHLIKDPVRRQRNGLRVTPGKVSAHAGRVAARAVGEAVCLALEGEVQALVTAPVSKQAMHLAGVTFPGQTEMLQRLCSSPHGAMMLVSPAMRVGLVTIHLPISKVPRALTPRLLRERIEVMHKALRTDWKIRQPSIAVLGLNPHAGEAGHLGKEELKVIVPVIRALRDTGIQLDGPIPADAFFARYKPGRHDAVIAMYHDQGLIPLKMTSRNRAVNVTVGLPVVRTSPDHGTAFDIAGKGIADPGSMIEAITLAVRMAKNRARSSGRKK